MNAAFARSPRPEERMASGIGLGAWSAIAKFHELASA
jgi:hypothetical protein